MTLRFAQGPICPGGNNPGGTGKSRRSPDGRVEECFEEAKGQVGLDQDEVRGGMAGWRRTSPLAMQAQAYLSATQHQTMGHWGGGKVDHWDGGS